MYSEIGIENEQIEELPSMEEVTTPEILSEDEIGIPELNKNRKLPTIMVEKVLENVFLFRDGTNTTYAQFSVSDHKEIWPVDSKRFKSWLYKIGRPLNNDEIPSSEHITSAQKYLEALAYDEPEIELFNRVAKSGEEFWYDLTNEKWQAIKINKDQWGVKDEIPPIFKRQSHQKKQVTPVNRGNPWKLFEFVKVPEAKRLLILVYVISCFIPDIPHPVLIIFGPPGAGKSMTMEFLRSIIDPSKAPRLKMPTTDKEIVQVFDHHYATFFDNLDILSKGFSDIVCRAVTGEGSEYRALYSNDDAIIRSYRRCVALNGINVAATQVDLLDRSILMELEKFPEGVRVEENQLREDFELLLPEILGGIFDNLVRAIKIYPTVKLKKLPRMADFAKWGYAIAEALGGHGEEFLKTYSDDQNERVHETINQNSLATAIVALIKERTVWEGNPTELLDEVEYIASQEKINTNSRSWPKNAAWLSRSLNGISPTLEHLGISFSRYKQNGQRQIAIRSSENTGHDVIPSKKDNESPKRKNNNLKFLKDQTANLTVSDCNDNSKTKNENIFSKSDCNDSMDTKIHNCSSNSYNKLSQEELWNKARLGDKKAINQFESTLKGNSSNNGEKVSK